MGWTVPDLDRVNFAALKKSIKVRKFVELDLGEPGKGGRWPCPIHGGEGYNFAANDERWKCYSCGAGGDLIDYVMLRDRLTLADAVTRLDPSGAFRIKGTGGASRASRGRTAAA